MLDKPKRERERENRLCFCFNDARHSVWRNKSWQQSAALEVYLSSRLQDASHFSLKRTAHELQTNPHATALSQATHSVRFARQTEAPFYLAELSSLIDKQLADADSDLISQAWPDSALACLYKREHSFSNLILQQVKYALEG